MQASYDDLQRAVAPALADLKQQRPWLEIRIEPATDPEGPLAFAWEPSGSGTGLYLSDASAAVEAVAGLADQLQEVVVEALWFAGRGSTWPACPQHPGTHPLSAAVVDGVAAWICPASREPIGRIGTLTLPGS